ncbi:hypothetical protein B0H13DRAFT_1926074 [Mycena leptocephala]|nr:hypothetical protein B0H13DRAFT_1926074 [Mycena leptocephala]
MLLLIRLRIPTSLTLRVPRPSVLSSTFLRPVCLRTFATESVPEDYITTTSSRREGHISHFPHPLKFIACGAERHLRKDFPHPGAERIKAMYAQPKKCFRCGGTHVIKECTQPAKCWFCGWTGHKRSDWPHAAEGGGGGIAVKQLVLYRISKSKRFVWHYALRPHATQTKNGPHHRSGNIILFLSFRPLVHQSFLSVLAVRPYHPDDCIELYSEVLHMRFDP